MKVLIVEDDVSNSALLSRLLLEQHYVADVVTDGQTGFALAITWEYDLILLSWPIPDTNGVSLCRRLREQGCCQPILLMTTSTDTQELIAGLDAGADDYVTKPFQPETLLAQIRALLRRGQGSVASPLLRWANLSLDPAAADVAYGTQPLSLTPKEYMLLELFLRNPKRVFSRSAIIDRLWSADASPSENAVTNLIKDLRQKLRKAGLKTEMIETIYGLGYRLKPAPETPAQSAEPEEGPKSAVPALGMTSFQETSEQFWPELLQQVATLEAALDQLGQNLNSSVSRQQAVTVASKIAYSLDSLGYSISTQRVRTIEQTLQRSQPLNSLDYLHLLQLQAELKARLLLRAQPVPSKPPTLLTQTPRVLVLDNEPNLTAQLSAQAPLWGLQLDCTANLEQALLRLKSQPVDLIILGLDLRPAAKAASLSVLESLHQAHPALPVVILTSQDSLEDRITVARLGGRVYLRKPLPSEEILQTVVQILPQPNSSEGNILIVDDDPVALALFRKVLQPWGLQITSLQDSTRFWQMLTATHPNLLVLDVDMPTFSGFDLCRVVRQDPSWSNLPIIIVTSHAQPAVLDQAFAAGADAFLTKPIEPSALVTRVIYWIERAQKNLRNTRQLPQVNG
jgi:DNA-binding response OmpR family regulator